tara:strand:- start:134 stop:535 length:402 start_codon:yes stop_codon:yes gene_type:complete
MASILKVDTLTGVSTADSISVTEGSTTINLQKGLAKAGVSVQGVDTFGINESFNISSASDEGTGHHNVVMTNTMSSTNYHPIIATGYADGNPGNTISTCWAETTTNVEFETSSAAGSNQDITEDYIVVFGDLA